MVVQTKDLWALVEHQQHIDPQDLTAAIEDQVTRRDLDYRSRVLIRDSVKALRHYWGPERVSAWLESSPHGREIETICRGPWDDDRGFSSLMRRVMDVTRPETIEQYLRELGGHVRKPLHLDIGGSAALILSGHLLRRTGDIDVVDEVPAEIRAQHALLEAMHARYGLELAHFQRHDLPLGWEQRRHTQRAFDQLQVALVDVYDIFLSKLFSIRTKDFDDLRALLPQLDKEKIIRQLGETTHSMLAAPDLRERARHNWYILFGENLPV
ncbi:hypothetical protein AYO40_02120 [Planctomycetaceae bacterium SCGC AG-212-D15]|nr:hypothetical protein AYO40_02120 [Planctomycetaceae bacterium SCGC AG-212-D15]